MATQFGQGGLGRRRFLTVSGGAVLGAALSGVTLAGCGGGSGSGGSLIATVDVGSNGRLADVSFAPASLGRAFFSRTGTIVISWSTVAPPPRSFTVTLRRYYEGGGDPSATEIQGVEVVRQGNSYTWEIRRSGGRSLDESACYFVELAASGESSVRRVFLTPPSPDLPDVNSATIDTSFAGNLLDVVITPQTGTVGIPRTVGASGILLDWSGSAPPARFTVYLRRFRQNRGNTNLSVDTQRVTISAAGAKQWLVRRRDNFDLEAGAPYFLELVSPGTDPIYPTFLVSNNEF